MRPDLALPRTATSKKEDKRFWITAFNSTIIYVLAYYVITAVHQFTKMAVSRHFHLRGSWDPSSIAYGLTNQEWWMRAVVGVYSAGPLACLLVGFGFYQWYWQRERANRGQLKLLLIWLALHGCNAVLGALVADTLTMSGFFFVPAWLFDLGVWAPVALAVAAGIGQVVLGYYAAIPFLQAHDSKTVMRYTRRRRMVLYTLIGPWVAGSVVVALAKGRYFTLNEFLHLFTMGLLLVPLALGCLNELFQSTVRRPRPTRVSWGLLGLTALLVLAWYLALSPPVAFS